MPNGFLSLTRGSSTVPITPSFPGKRKPQCHCLPTASNTAASFGTSTKFAHTNKPGANMVATPTVVTTVSHHSSFLFSGSYSAGKQWHWGFRFPDRKSTRLNSSHGYISYAVFCLKKKNHK